LVSLFDVNQFQFEIKEDTFGLGYKRLNVNQLFTGDSAMVGATATSAHKEVDSDIASLLFPDLAKSSNDKSKKKRGMTGQVSF
jgi:hypothetical protein